MGTVLVVEDDDDLRAAICDVLNDFGFPTLSACDGAEALALLEGDELPTLILLDLMMPVMNGWAFRARQEADARLAPIPVIVMTAAAQLDDAAITGVDIIRKPVRIDDLVGRVRAHMEALEFDGSPSTTKFGIVMNALDADDSGPAQT